MANKRMKTLTFPGLSDTYTFVQADSTLTQAGEAADAKVTGDALADRAGREPFIRTHNGYMYIESRIQLAGLNNSGEVYADSERATFVEYEKLAFPAEVRYDSGYAGAICFYDDSKALTSRVSVDDAGAVYIPPDVYFRLMIRKSPLASIADAETMRKHVVVYGARFPFLGEIDSSVNINTLYESGLYRTKGSIPTNWPVSYDRSSALYGILLVFRPSATMTYQVVYDYRGNHYNRRRSSEDTSGWTAWVQSLKYTTYASDKAAIDSAISGLTGSVAEYGAVVDDLRSGYAYLNSTIVLGDLNGSGATYVDSQRAVFEEYMMVGVDSILQYDAGYTGAVCLYDNTKTFIPGTRMTPTDGGYIRIPANTYFRASIRTSPISTISDVSAMAKKCRLLNAAGVDAYDAAAVRPLAAKIFKRVGCIGDSYTEGYINAGGEVQHRADYAWPHYMETLTGNVWTNFGVGGSSCKSWVRNVDRYSKLSDVQASGNKCQAYVIGLMINDRDTSSANYVAVGTAEDIGTDADSYYAYYYKLILAVHAVNADAPIFCNTCPKALTSYVPYNQAVRDIVAYCQQAGLPVYLCDLAGDYYTTQYYKSPVYTTDLINGHYTGIGYEMMAECYLRVLSEVILANVSAFQTVHMIDYDEPTE